MSSSESLGDENKFQKRESLLIKDLQMKISVLSNGVLDERTKKSELENEIARLKGVIAEQEMMLLEKENVNTKIHNEKSKIQSELEHQKSRSSYGSFSGSNARSIFSLFQRRNSNPDSHCSNNNTLHESCAETEDTCKVEKEVETLKAENINLKKRIKDLTEDYDLAKQNYQFLINNHVEKLKSLEISNNEKNKVIDENNKRLEVMLESYKKYDILQSKYESANSELITLQAKYTEMENNYQIKIKKQEKELNHNKKSLLKHETESSNLAKKLAELKNAVIEQNIVIQSFKGERKGTLFNHTLEVIILFLLIIIFKVTFGRTDDNDYIMILKENNSEEYVNVEDIEFLKQNDKNIELVDLKYIVSLFRIIY